MNGYQGGQFDKDKIESPLEFKAISKRLIIPLNGIKKQRAKHRQEMKSMVSQGWSFQFGTIYAR